MPKLLDEMGKEVFDCPYTDEGKALCAQKLRENPGWTMGSAPAPSIPGSAVSQVATPASAPGFASGGAVAGPGYASAGRGWGVTRVKRGHRVR